MGELPLVLVCTIRDMGLTKFVQAMTLGCHVFIYMPLVKSPYKKIIFIFLKQNICCGYSKNRLNETVVLST